MENFDNCSIRVVGECNSLFSLILLMFKMFYNNYSPPHPPNSFLVFPLEVGCFFPDNAFILCFCCAIGPVSTLRLTLNGQRKEESSEIHRLIFKDIPLARKVSFGFI